MPLIYMRTKDLIAKRERRERKHAREQRNAKTQAPIAPENEAYTLPSSFPDAVLEATKQFHHTSISEQEIMRRRDMRDILTFTIDPDDAKDFCYGFER